ncbi:MAG: DnaJ domain-containing protein [Caldilineaceae bacterium]|nr:DnaJ domain-containing protein [Caldilineaceae bacterium]
MPQIDAPKTEDEFDIAPGEEPYDTLDLPRNADDEAIRKAYFQMVRRFPPEKEPEKFREIRRAYDQIRTADRRKITEIFLLQSLPPLPNRRLPPCDLQVHPEDLLVLDVLLAARPVEESFRSFT